MFTQTVKTCQSKKRIVFYWGRYWGRYFLLAPPNQPVGVGKTLGRCPSPRRAIYEDRHLIDIILLIGCTLAQSPLYDVGAIAARRGLDVDSLESICRW